MPKKMTTLIIQKPKPKPQKWKKWKGLLSLNTPLSEAVCYDTTKPYFIFLSRTAEIHASYVRKNYN